MPKRFYDIMPEFFPVCIHDNCKLADTCLHYIAYQRLCKEAEQMTLLNPQRCTKDKVCPYYRSNAPVRYAFGFSTFKSKMLPGQWSAFVGKLREKWGRIRFYDRQRGDIALPPDEQEFVMEALRRAGVTESFDFDRYEEILTWYD